MRSKVDVRQEGPVVLHGLLEVHLVHCGPAVTRPLEITLEDTEVLPVPGSGERAAAVVSLDGELDLDFRLAAMVVEVASVAAPGGMQAVPARVVSSLHSCRSSGGLGLAIAARLPAAAMNAGMADERTPSTSSRRTGCPAIREHTWHRSACPPRDG